MPVCYPHRAGEPYRPSNGTEGMMFEEIWCNHCTRMSAECEIYSAALLYDLGDKDYPSQWVYDPGGRPMCTAFCDRRQGELFNGID